MVFIRATENSAFSYDGKQKANNPTATGVHKSFSEMIREEIRRLHTKLPEEQYIKFRQIYTTAPIAKMTPNIPLASSSGPNSTVNLDFNEAIDDSKQNPYEGDCWLLTGLNSLKSTTKGQIAIRNAIEIAVEDDPNSDIIVHLKGVNKHYRLTREEIINNQDKLSSGDADVKAVELAIRKYREEIIKSGKGKDQLNSTYQNFCGTCNPKSPNEGGTPDELIFYLTGIKPEATYVKYDDPQYEKYNTTTPDEILNKVKTNPDNYATWVGYNEIRVDSNGNKYQYAHACAIAKVTEDAVYTVDPEDSSKILKKNKAEFIKSIYEITTTNLSSIQ